MRTAIKMARTRTREEWLTMFKRGFGGSAGVRISDPMRGVNSGAGLRLDIEGRVPKFLATYALSGGDLCGLVPDPRERNNWRAAYWREVDGDPVMMAFGGESFGTCASAGHVYGSVRHDRRDHAFRWPIGAAEPELLPSFPFSPAARVLAVNQTGVAVGYCSVFVHTSDELLPCVWRPAADGRYSAIESLPLPDGFAHGVAYDINAEGIIVGAVSSADDQIEKPCIWQADGETRVLDFEGALHGINSKGWMVGALNDEQHLIENFGERAISMAGKIEIGLGYELWGIDGNESLYGYLESDETGGNFLLRITILEH